MLTTDAGLSIFTSQQLQTFSSHCLDVNICFIRFLLWNHLYDYSFHYEHLGIVSCSIGNIIFIIVLLLIYFSIAFFFL